MTPADMGLWEEFYSLEPWGPSQVAYGLGTVASILVNKDRKRGTPAVKASDFYPGLKKAAAKPNKKKQEEALKSGLNSMKRRRKK